MWDKGLPYFHHSPTKCITNPTRRTPSMPQSCHVILSKRVQLRSPESLGRIGFKDHTLTLLLRAANPYNFKEKKKKHSCFPSCICEERLSDLTFPKCLSVISCKTRDLCNIFLTQSEQQPTSHREGGGFSQTNFISLSLVICWKENTKYIPQSTPSSDSSKE